MKILLFRLILVLLLAGVSLPLFAAGGHDPWLAMLKVDRLETHFEDGPDPVQFDGDLWIGRDLHKLWLKANASYVDGTTKALRMDLMYGIGVAPFWDLLVGVSRDQLPKPEKDWLALTLQGTAPQKLEVEASLYGDENGLVNLVAEVEYEYMLTRRLVLSPELAVSAWSKDAPEEGVWAGIEAMEAGLRLAWEIRRELAPYIGVERELHFGDRADAIRAAGGSVGATTYLAGVRFWF